MIVKLGFMPLARDYIKEINGTSKHSYIWVNYHFNNFVFASKSFLDSVAITLNNEYKLEYSGGGIELSKGGFVDTLAKKNDKIAVLIKSENKWIGDVVKWRTALIHRMSAAVMPMYGDPGPNGNHSAHIPMEPFALFDIPSYQQTKLKHGKLGQDILPFCQDWIGKSQKLFETVCTEITSQYILKGG